MLNFRIGVLGGHSRFLGLGELDASLAIEQLQGLDLFEDFDVLDFFKDLAGHPGVVLPGLLGPVVATPINFCRGQPLFFVLLEMEELSLAFLVVLKGAKGLIGVDNFLLHELSDGVRCFGLLPVEHNEDFLLLLVPGGTTTVVQNLLDVVP